MNGRILNALMASTVLGLVASPVVAAEITGPTSSTYVIGDHDSLTITSSGSIAVTGNDNEGVDGYGDANHITVINNGSITTNGLRSDGITVRDFDANAGDETEFNSISNSGSINVSGDGSDAISLINSGASDYDFIVDPYSSGGNDPSIYGGYSRSTEVSNNAVDNSGILNVNGEDAAGIKLFSYSEMVFYGDSEDGGAVFWHGKYDALLQISDISASSNVDNNQITNSGQISTGGGVSASGISVRAESDVYANAYGYVRNDGVTQLEVVLDGVHSSARASSNLISNSGLIAGWVGGVDISAVAENEVVVTAEIDRHWEGSEYSDLDYRDQVIAYADHITSVADVSDNIVTNESGSVISSFLGAAINLEARSDVEAYVYANTFGERRGVDYGTGMDANVIAVAEGVRGESSIENNHITNYGVLQSLSGDVIRLASFADANAYAQSQNTYGDSESYVYSGYARVTDLVSQSQLSNNVVHNTEYVIAGGGDGIHVSSNARSGYNTDELYLIGDEYYDKNVIVGRSDDDNFGSYFYDSADARMDHVYATSLIENNTISNSGSINVYGSGSQGVEIAGRASAYASVYAFNNDADDASASVTVGAMDAASHVDNNIVDSSGYIRTSGESQADGIRISSEAVTVAEARVETYGDVQDNPDVQFDAQTDSTGEINSHAFASDNIVSNSGTIVSSSASYSGGIKIGAQASTYVDMQSFNYDSGYGDNTVTVRNVYANAYASNNAVTNSGRIETYGDEFSVGIGVASRARVEVDAEAYTYYEDAEASIEYTWVRAETEGNAIVNSGVIATHGDDSDGVILLARVESNLDVRGHSEDDAEDDWLDYFGGEATVADNEVSNSGSIRTYGTNSHGIRLVAEFSDVNDSHNENYGVYDFYSTIRDNTVTSSGSIVVLGANSDGIRIDAEYGSDVYGNTVNVSGMVVAAYGEAIEVDGYTNTFNFAAPAFFGGYLALGGGGEGENAVLNIETGPSHSVVWHIDGQIEGDAPTVTGNVPYAWDAVSQTFATIDPSAVSAAPNMLGDLSGLVSDIVQDGAAKVDPSSRIWAAFGAVKQTYQGNEDTTLDQDTQARAVALGFNADLGEAIGLGGMVGYAWNELAVNSRFAPSFDNKAEGFFGGVNADATMGVLKLGVGVNGGVLDHEGRRFVNDNLADNGFAEGGTAGSGDATLGQAWATSSYNSWWISPEVSAELNLEVGEGFNLRPHATARYAMQTIDAYSEQTDDVHVGEGATAVETASFEEQKVNLFEADLGVELERTIAGGVFTIGGGYLLRNYQGDDFVGSTLLGQSVAVPVDFTDASMPYAGASLNFGTGHVMLDASGRVTYLDGDFGYQLKGMLKGAF